ncbi:MAG: hypothetical protein EXS36_17290 [Pedosphaera sp.]|nr:hypothetical protein [Pedosphaera sp.]
MKKLDLKSQAAKAAAMKSCVNVLFSEMGPPIVYWVGEGKVIPWGFDNDPLSVMLGDAKEAKARSSKHGSLADYFKSTVDRISTKLSRWESLADATKNGGKPFDEAKERKELVGLAYYSGSLMKSIKMLKFDKAVRHQKKLDSARQRKGRKGRANPTWEWFDKFHPECIDRTSVY